MENNTEHPFEFLKLNESVTLELPVVSGDSTAENARVLYTQNYSGLTEDSNSGLVPSIKKPGDFVLVGNETYKKNKKTFLGAIKQVNEGTQEYIIKYLRSVDNIKKTFKFQESDEDYVPFNEILDVEIPDFSVDSRGKYIFEKPITEVQE